MSSMVGVEKMMTSTEGEGNNSKEHFILLPEHYKKETQNVSGSYKFDMKHECLRIRCKR